MFVKSSRPSLFNWSTALLKAREAQSVSVKPNFASENTWEEDCRRGMDTLNERCDGEISPGIIFINVNSIVSNVCSRSALIQIGMKVIQFAKSAASWTKLLRCINQERSLKLVGIVVSPCD
jgi:hypothetical protein